MSKSQYISEINCLLSKSMACYFLPDKSVVINNAHLDFNHFWGLVSKLCQHNITCFTSYRLFLMIKMNTGETYLNILNNSIFLEQNSQLKNTSELKIYLWALKCVFEFYLNSRQAVLLTFLKLKITLLD